MPHRTVLKWIEGYQKNGLLKDSGKCRDCGINILLSSTHCKKCKGKILMEKNKGKRPPVEILKKLLETMTKQDIGKKYNVSDASVHKWIKTYKKHNMWY